MNEKENPEFELGQQVFKTGGDYTFSGVVVAAFHKTSGKVRYVVENPEGILHIFSGKQLVKPNPLLEKEPIHFRHT